MILSPSEYESLFGHRFEEREKYHADGMKRQIAELMAERDAARQEAARGVCRLTKRARFRAGRFGK